MENKEQEKITMKSVQDKIQASLSKIASLVTESEDANRAKEALKGVDLRVSGIVENSIVDGLGLRLAVFVQGCERDCKGCHNKGTHDKEGGKLMPLSTIAALLEKDMLLKGITLSGGEPFFHAKQLALLSEYATLIGMDVWCYTGYTYEELLCLAKENQEVKAFLETIDVLVDGPYMEEKKSSDKEKFRGSKNQRIIDLRSMRKSKKPHKILLLKV